MTVLHLLYSHSVALFYSTIIIKPLLLQVRLATCNMIRGKITLAVYLSVRTGWRLLNHDTINIQTSNYDYNYQSLNDKNFYLYIKI